MFPTLIAQDETINHERNVQQQADVTLLFYSTTYSDLYKTKNLELNPVGSLKDPIHVLKVGYLLLFY